MKLKVLLSALSMGFIVVSSMSFAQEDVLRPHGRSGGNEQEDQTNYLYRRSPITLGFEGGINYNMFSQDIAWLKDPQTGNDYVTHGTIYDKLNSASGISPHFGVFVGFDFSNTIGVMLRLAYDSKYVSKSVTGTDYSYSALSGFTEHPMTLDASMKASYVALTPLLRIQATPELFFTVGPTIQFLLGDVETKWTPTVTDQGAFLSDFLFWQAYGFGPFYTQSITTKSSESIAKAFTPRIGLEAGVGYKIPLTRTMFLVPQARFQLMFSKILEDDAFYIFPISDPTNQTTVEQSTNKQLHSLQLALALWFDL